MANEIQDAILKVTLSAFNNTMLLFTDGSLQIAFNGELLNIFTFFICNYSIADKSNVVSFS
jgi:hypothetical protein